MSWQPKKKICINLYHYQSKKSSFICVQMNWVCSSEAQGLCENDSYSSWVTIFLNVTRVRVTKGRDASRVIDSSHTITVNPRESEVFSLYGEFAYCVTEMSGLWNFSVRVQSCSNKIESDPVLIRKIYENHESDPVLIRQGQIMYFYFASWGKRTTGAILLLAKNDWSKSK